MTDAPSPPKPVTFPVYADRWTGATRHLSLAARGAYFDFLLWCFDHNQPLPLDVETRARIAACSVQEVEAVWKEISYKWKPTPAGFVNASLERKRVKHADFLSSQREKAAKGAAARWRGHVRKNAPGIARASQKSDNTGLMPVFDDFQNSEFPKKSENRDAPGIARANAPGNAPLMPSISNLRSRSLQHPNTERRSGFSELDPHLKKDHRAARGIHTNGFAKTAEPNPKLLDKLAIAVVRNPNTISEWVALLKEQAAKHRVAYTGQAIHRAVTKAEHVVRKQKAKRN